MESHSSKALIPKNFTEKVMSMVVNDLHPQNIFCSMVWTLGSNTTFVKFLHADGFSHSNLSIKLTGIFVQS